MADFHVTGARAHLEGEVSEARHFAEISVASFVAVLLFSLLAPGLIVSASGVVLLVAGLFGAAGLSIARWPRERAGGAWDYAALATFLGFVAVLVSDATPAI